ncbi:MAG: glycosyltransferase [Armatimonadota bacterium]
MPRLKVLFVTSSYPSRKNPALGVFVQEHAKAVSLYNDVTVLCREVTDGSVGRIYEIADNVEYGLRTLRVRYRKFPIPKISYLIYLWGMLSAFRKLVREEWRPDVIHAHFYVSGIPAVLIGKLYRIPVIITEHSTAFPRGLVRGLKRIAAKFAFEHAAVVCPVSEDLRKHIERLGVRARFHVVPNVVDTSLFSPPTARGAKEDGRKHLLVVALLDPKKGIPYLLEALAQLRKKRDDFVLDIVGDGPNRAEYEELTRKLGLHDVVRFHGLKTKQEVAEFMKRCDIFVLPSLFETFGVVLIEALSCGKPVIATDVGGPTEILTKEEVGKLVPPGNSQALAMAIDYMLDNYERYDPEVIASYVRSSYTYEAVGQKLAAIYSVITTVRARGKGV